MLMIFCISFAVIALILYFIHKYNLISDPFWDKLDKRASVVSAIISLMSLIASCAPIATNTDPPKIQCDNSNAGAGGVNGDGSLVGVCADTININPTVPPTSTPLPTPTPASHIFDTPKGGFDSIEFNWISEPLKEGHQYGAVTMKICTKINKYWIYAEEIEPDPKETIKNTPFTKTDECVNRTIAENVTPQDLIRSSAAVISDDIQNGSSISMRVFDIRRTDKNDIIVNEREPISRILLEQPVAPADPFGCVDNPKPGYVLSNRVRIGGWATADGSIVTKVELWVDGLFYENARYGTPRPELDNKNSGWYLDWDTKKLSNGPHTIEIRVTAANGLTMAIACGDGPPAIPIEIKN